MLTTTHSWRLRRLADVLEAASARGVRVQMMDPACCLHAVARRDNILVAAGLPLRFCAQALARFFGLSTGEGASLFCNLTLIAPTLSAEACVNGLIDPAIAVPWIRMRAEEPAHVEPQINLDELRRALGQFSRMFFVDEAASVSPFVWDSTLRQLSIPEPPEPTPEDEQTANDEEAGTDGEEEEGVGDTYAVIHLPCLEPA